MLIYNVYKKKKRGRELKILIAVAFIVGLIFENIYYYLNIKRNLNKINLPILTLVFPVLGLISMGIGVKLGNISNCYDILILIIHLLLAMLLVFVTIYVFVARKDVTYKVFQILAFILILAIAIPFSILASSVMEIVSVVYVLIFIPRVILHAKGM